MKDMKIAKIGTYQDFMTDDSQDIQDFKRRINVDTYKRTLIKASSRESTATIDMGRTEQNSYHSHLDQSLDGS